MWCREKCYNYNHISYEFMDIWRNYQNPEGKRKKKLMSDDSRKPYKYEIHRTKSVKRCP